MIAALAHVPHAVKTEILCVNAGLIAVWVSIVVFTTGPRRKSFNVARDWLPFLQVLLFYHEMGRLTVPSSAHLLEARWVIWDRALLAGCGKTAIESLGPVLPSVLELAYLLTYALGPVSVAMLYAYGRRKQIDNFLILFLTAVFLCYAQFPFWPSEPPRILFPAEDLPAYTTLFRRLNLWVLRTGGIHTSVFPSGHVAAAFASAAGMWLYLPEHRYVARALFVTAMLIAVATVYGRYHYVADALAGFLMAGACFLMALWRSYFSGRRSLP